MKMGYSEIEYKGHAIMRDEFMVNAWTVLFEGDEVCFKTVEEAKSFIDKVF